MIPQISKGNSHVDARGIVQFNNDFNALAVKRIYFIENANTAIVRGWQGHKIEQRWFIATNGSFKIGLIAVDNWDAPSHNLEQLEFILTATTLDVLHVPAGYITRIQALEEGSKLMLLADYSMGEIQDEYRFDINYFKTQIEKND
jgi:dTDP-4-dehydrorhamnose 3,5-epimerase-like enzyme